MSKQTSHAPTASTEGPCPTLIEISRTPRHWKFAQHHCTTRPPLTRNSSSLNIFKTRINNNVSLPSSYYFTGKRLGQIYHARLRNKCSSLRHHLFSMNIIECPRCICGAVEDTHHYLLVCDQYTNIRRELLTTVSGICNPTLNVLLNGDQSLSLEQNKYIVKAVQDFILKSKRFQ